ncbi:MAG: IPExxxVDY family protein [Bacteroidia bacterium]
MKQRFSTLNDDDLNLFDFEVVGICCPLKDYKLSWLLNKMLGINLVQKTTDVELRSKQGQSSHSVFTCRNDDEFVGFSLIKNRAEALLIPELPNADYFLKLEGEINLEQLIKKLNTMDDILAVFSVDVTNLKSKEHFII